VDRFTKIVHFCLTNSTVTPEGTTDLYLKYVFKNHGLPNNIVSDCGTQFVSKFTRRLLKLLDVKGNRSTAYYAQSDEQMERMNQMLERYLYIYCSFHQDDWNQLLLLTEFAYNNAKNSFTGISPFFVNYGYHPRAMLKVRTNTDTHDNLAAKALIDYIQNAHTELHTTLGQAQKTYKQNYDRKA
jgi:hypothetical protein